MRGLALATMWFGLAFAFTGAVADGLQTWRTAGHNPYDEWVAPDARAPSVAEATTTRSHTPRAER